MFILMGKKISHNFMLKIFAYLTLCCIDFDEITFTETVLPLTLSLLHVALTFVVCGHYDPLQTVWTQIRTDRMLVLI